LVGVSARILTERDKWERVAQCLHLRKLSTTSRESRRRVMKYYKCEECWESLAQYKDSDERNCENHTCQLAGLNQIGKEIEEWEVA
jgi:hypothetical protein